MGHIDIIRDFRHARYALQAAEIIVPRMGAAGARRADRGLSEIEQ
jgi:hypothetical protein